MKSSTSLFLSAVAPVFLAVSASAQVVSSVGSETTLSTIPGSPSDYVIFGYGNYNKIGGDSAGSSKNLPDFDIVGGEAEHSGDAGFSTINTPGSVGSIATGGITSPNTIAVGLELLNVNSSGHSSTTGFNFNDFNVYVMIDNAPGDSIFQNTGVGLDARLNNVELSPVNVATSNNNTSLGSADFVEYNVTGLGSAVAAAELANPGENDDLVLRIFKPGGQSAILGGISFQSVEVPEPSTYALLLAGFFGLAIAVRRKASKQS
jgi:hypothetical protein